MKANKCPTRSEYAGKSRHVLYRGQIGLNAVAILGGIVGDAAFSQLFTACSPAICRQNSLSN